MPRIVVSVINDLVTDQRVHKVCTTLREMGFEIHLIGRKLKNSLPIERKYKVTRMSLLFTKGFFFYAEFNIRLFLKLFFTRKDILLSNDLDTLLPNFLISKILCKKIVYDSHELFTEIPELVHRTKVQNIWLSFEKFILPKLKNVYTVNDSIASFYMEKYNVDVKTIKNTAPQLQNKNIDEELSRRIKEDKKMLILQGTGINVNRGAEEAIQMMQYLDNFILYIIGGGDVFDELKKMVREYNLKTKVVIKNRMPYDELIEYTKVADLGLSFDKADNLNYEYSLPNKIFDYIQAETPILASNRIEVASLIENENIGAIVNEINPKKLAEHVRKVMSDVKTYNLWKNNLKKVSKKYCWENEALKLKEIFENIK